MSSHSEEAPVISVPDGTMPRECRDAGMRRLKSIEGQVHELQRMFDEGRPCQEILMQVSSAQEALRKVG